MKKKFKLKVMKLVPEWITVEAESAEQAEDLALEMQHVVAISKTLPCVKVEDDRQKVCND